MTANHGFKKIDERKKTRKQINTRRLSEEANFSWKVGEVIGRCIGELFSPACSLIGRAPEIMLRSYAFISFPIGFSFPITSKSLKHWSLGEKITKLNMFTHFEDEIPHYWGSYLVLVLVLWVWVRLLAGEAWDYRWNALRVVFLRDPSPYLASFGKKHWILRKLGQQARPRMKPGSSIHKFWAPICSVTSGTEKLFGKEW